MTTRQVELARHALGLNRMRRSYRNHFVTGFGHPDYDEWCRMVSMGLATQRRDELFTSGDIFTLTKAGAEAALRPLESLDPEEFQADPAPLCEQCRARPRGTLDPNMCDECFHENVTGHRE